MDAILTYTLLFIALFFEVFLLVAFLDRRRVQVSRESSSNALPHVAIVVPCYNEESTVSATLRSLLALDYPQDKLEILIVDDGSHDQTLASAEAFASDPRVRIFQKENGGKHTAMNLALEKTSAEFIGCLDADSVVAPEALRNIVRVFDDARVAAVTPGIHVRDPKTLLQYMQHVEYQISIFNRFMLAALGSAFITPGPFSVFRSAVVRELGGWRHGHSTEDMELALRIQSAGHLIANAPQAVVHTTTPHTIPRLFRQRVRWTYGFLRNAIDYRHMIGNRAFGNLGIIILPSAVISIGAGIYFFFHILFSGAEWVYQEFLWIKFTQLLPQASFELFYINTSAMWFLVYASIALILILISAGSFIGTGKRMLPASTPLFLFLYSFLVPMWLSAALVRALLRTGVRWR